jgi:protoheme IX farnesyltransferase
MKPDSLVMSPVGSKLQDLFVLSKARVNALVVATTAGGYYMAVPDRIDPMALAVTCLGTALVASGAAALNQVQERDIDRLMDRTRLRPVADGRMSASEGSLIALLLAAVGVVVLWLGSGFVAAAVAAATFACYTAIYTPLKRRTSLATIIGAVPGALPPLIGWAAARGSLLEAAPWALFLIMFLWQLPHFLAIAWLYRDDYARAGLPMLPVIDQAGALTGLQTVLWSATLIPVSELPYLQGLSGPAYAIGALLLGIAQLLLALRFAFRRADATARWLFYGSITYLPLLWLMMGLARRT